MSRADLYLVLGAALFALGAVRLLLADQVMTRVLALNVAGWLTGPEGPVRLTGPRAQRRGGWSRT